MAEFNLEREIRRIPTEELRRRLGVPAPLEPSAVTITSLIDRGRPGAVISPLEKYTTQAPEELAALKPNPQAREHFDKLVTTAAATPTQEGLERAAEELCTSLSPQAVEDLFRETLRLGALALVDRNQAYSFKHPTSHVRTRLNPAGFSSVAQVLENVYQKKAEQQQDKPQQPTRDPSRIEGEERFDNAYETIGREAKKDNPDTNLVLDEALTMIQIYLNSERVDWEKIHDTLAELLQRIDKTGRLSGQVFEMASRIEPVDDQGEIIEENLELLRNLDFIGNMLDRDDHPDPQFYKKLGRINAEIALAEGTPTSTLRRFSGSEGTDTYQEVAEEIKRQVLQDEGDLPF